MVPGILPRVVVIWVVQVDGALYVVCNSASGRVERLGDGAAVEMRLSSNTYTLNARLVTQDLERLLNAYKDKYRSNYPDMVAGFPTLAEASGQLACSLGRSLGLCAASRAVHALQRKQQGHMRYGKRREGEKGITHG